MLLVHCVHVVQRSFLLLKYKMKDILRDYWFVVFLPLFYKFSLNFALLVLLMFNIMPTCVLPAGTSMKGQQ